MCRKIIHNVFQSDFYEENVGRREVLLYELFFCGSPVDNKIRDILTEMSAKME